MQTLYSLRSFPSLRAVFMGAKPPSDSILSRSYGLRRRRAVPHPRGPTCAVEFRDGYSAPVARPWASWRRVCNQRTSGGWSGIRRPL